MTKKTEAEKLLNEIQTFISFAVGEDKCDSAFAFVKQYKDDMLALRLFYEHYSALPNAVEEPVTKVFQLKVQRGVHCLLLHTESEGFIYMVSVDEVLYAGSRIEDFSDELIVFVDCGDKDKFVEKLKSAKGFSVYSPSKGAKIVLCPACGVAEGEAHVLGCIVEVCPWCDGQLNNCNCRFEKMEIEEFTTEKQIKAFEELLDTEGRVPFAKDHKIAYPGLSKGLDKS